MKKSLAVALGLILAVVALVGPGQASSTENASVDLSTEVNIDIADLELTPQMSDIAAEASVVGILEFSDDQVDGWFAGDAIAATLPDGTVMGFSRVDMEPSAAGAEVWSGLNANEQPLTISRMNGFVTLAFQLDEGLFTIQPIDDQYHMLFVDGRDPKLHNEMPLTAMNPGFQLSTGAQATVGALGPDFADQALAEASVNGVDVIDVMIVYDNSSTSQFGSDAAAEANFVATVDFANVVYANTDLDIRLFLVDMTKISHTSTGNEFTELPAFADPGDGNMDQIHTIRNQVRADLVTLVTPIQGCGLAYVLTQGNGPLAELGFSVIDPQCMTPNTPAYPHEIGHNLGGAHDDAAATNGAHWPGGLGYVDQTHGFVTIMSYAPANGCCQYIPLFSNTIKTWNGWPTGDSGHNNRDVFAQHASAVSKYRSGLASAPTNLGADAGDKSVKINWSAPKTDGGYGITGYSVTASPGSRNCTTNAFARSCTVTGLSNGTSYTFTVKALNNVGTSPGSKITATPNSVIDPGMAISANSTGKTVIAAIKADGNLYTRTNKNNANQWNGFVKQGAGGWATVDVEITEDGKIYLAAVKNSGRLYTRIFNGSSWGGWVAHGSDSWSTSVPPAIAATNTKFTYAAVKDDGRMFTRSYSNGSWKGYTAHGASGWLAVDLTSDGNGNIWMVGVKDYGRLYTRKASPSAWGAWVKHGSDTWSTTTVPSIDASANKVVFGAVKDDGRMYTRQYNNNAWQGYVSHGASGWVGIDVAVTGNNVHVAGTKSYGRLYTRGTAGTTWTAWVKHGADSWSTLTDPAVVITQGKARLLGTKANGALYTQFYSGSWGAYVAHGASTWLG